MKKINILLVTMALIIISSITVFAGTWKNDANGWWYENDDGSFTKSDVQEIDGQRYLFDKNGYLVTDSFTGKNGVADANGVLQDYSVLDYSCDDYKIHFTGARLVKTTDSKIVQALLYDYTNTSDRVKSPSDANLDMQMFQNGVECQRSYARGIDTARESVTYRDLMPGTTVQAITRYSVDINTPIVVRYGKSNNKKQFNIKVNQLIN